MLMFILFGVFIVLFLWFRKFSNYWEDKGIPGPKPWPIVGNIGENFFGKKTLGQLVVDIYRKYDGYPFVGFFRGTTPCLLIRDPDFVNRILVKDFNSFRNNELSIDKNLDPLFGCNPFALKDQEWRDTRQILSPGFTSGRMKNIFPIFTGVSKNFIKFIENHPTATTDGIETRSLTKRLTLDNVAKTAFGIDGKAFESYDKISEFNELANGFLTPGTAYSLFLFFLNIFPFLTRYFYLSFVPKDVQNKLVDIISEAIKYRRDNNIQANDYLQFLLQLGKEKNLSDVEITSHACTFFIDGYETSSLVMSNLLMHLALNLQYQDKVREEIKQYEKENNGVLTYEALHEMPWLSACFFESLRLSPPADYLAKVCTEPFEYSPTNPDFKQISVKLAPGNVVILPYSMCDRDEKYFNDPEKFTPERMLDRDGIDKSIFFPFGNGPRICIGQRLGIMQVKLATAQILKHFELSPSSKLKLPIKFIPFSILNEVQGGIWLKYKKL